MTYDVFIEAGLDDDENEPNENTIDGDHDDTFDDILDASMNEAESLG